MQLEWFYSYELVARSERLLTEWLRVPRAMACSELESDPTRSRELSVCSPGACRVGASFARKSSARSSISATSPPRASRSHHAWINVATHKAGALRGQPVRAGELLDDAIDKGLVHLERLRLSAHGGERLAVEP